MIGTAPRNPTQLINTRSRRLKPRNGSNPANTERGRAKKIIHADKMSAGMAIGSRSLGLTNSPSTGEHGDLRQPGEAVEILQDAVAVANRPITQQKTAQINSQNTAAFQRRG